jgi:hypothetical protein
MFTWIPIHEEATQRLLEYKDRSHELVTILAKMNARHFKTIKIDDQGPDGSTFQLKEIAPFTFLANFNLGHLKMMLGFSQNGQKNRPTVQTPLGVFFLNRLA